MRIPGPVIGLIKKSNAQVLAIGVIAVGLAGGAYALTRRVLTRRDVRPPTGKQGRDVRFTIRPELSSQGGGFAVTAVDAREALNHVRDMIARGLTDVHILDQTGRRYDLVELERLTAEGETDVVVAAIAEPENDSAAGWKLTLERAEPNGIASVIAVVIANREAAEREISRVISGGGKLEPMSVEEVAGSGLGPGEVGRL